MPIEVSTAIEAFDQEEFHVIARKIMGVVFDIHNEFGPLLDEELYKLEIAERCHALGLQPVEREVRIQVRHGTQIGAHFLKSDYIAMLWSILWAEPFSLLS